MDSVTPEILEQANAYVSFRRAEGLRTSTLNDVRYRILAIARDCGFNRLQDATPEMITKWFIDSSEIDKVTGKAKRSPNTRKRNLTYLWGFFEWAIRLGLIKDNPCRNAPRPKKIKRDLRKLRRAFTAKEVENLCYVTRYRPLAVYAVQRLPNWMRSTHDQEVITFENVERLAMEALAMRHTDQLAGKERNGQKWELIYRILAFTGLRWNELRTLKVSHVELGDEPRLHLCGEFTKNGNSDTLPLNKELAAKIENWINLNRLNLDDLLIPEMPAKGTHRLDRDLVVAGIAKVDPRGRSVDIHSLRYSFATSLALRNVSPRLAQRLMRHSSIEMTIGIYTDVGAFDERAAVDSLSKDPAKQKRAKAKPAKATPEATDWQAMIAERLLATATPEQLADLLKSTAK